MAGRKSGEKGEAEIQKCEYLENKKSFLDEIKSLVDRTFKLSFNQSIV